MTQLTECLKEQNGIHWSIASQVFCILIWRRVGGAHQVEILPNIPFSLVIECLKSGNLVLIEWVWTNCSGLPWVIYLPRATRYFASMMWRMLLSSLRLLRLAKPISKHLQWAQLCISPFRGTYMLTLIIGAFRLCGLDLRWLKGSTWSDHDPLWKDFLTVRFGPSGPCINSVCRWRDTLLHGHAMNLSRISHVQRTPEIFETCLSIFLLSLVLPKSYVILWSESSRTSSKGGARNLRFWCSSGSRLKEFCGSDRTVWKPIMITSPIQVSWTIRPPSVVILAIHLKDSQSLQWPMSLYRHLIGEVVGPFGSESSHECLVVSG